MHNGFLWSVATVLSYIFRLVPEYVANIRAKNIANFLSYIRTLHNLLCVYMYMHLLGCLELSFLPMLINNLSCKC